MTHNPECKYCQTLIYPDVPSTPRFQVAISVYDPSLDDDLYKSWRYKCREQTVTILMCNVFLLPSSLKLVVYVCLSACHQVT